MKAKITTREVRERSEQILSVGADDLQHLLRYKSPDAYHATAGWNYDVYFLAGLTICTGYRSTPKSTVKRPSFDELQVWEKEAQAIRDLYPCEIDYTLLIEKMDDLLNAFKKEVLSCIS